MPSRYHSLSSYPKTILLARSLREETALADGRDESSDIEELKCEPLGSRARRNSDMRQDLLFRSLWLAVKKNF